MNEIMKAYASVSVSAALLTMVLVLLRPLYKRKFSQRWQYYIWLVVVARFLLPWNPGNGFIGNLFQAQAFSEPAANGNDITKSGSDATDYAAGNDTAENRAPEHAENAVYNGMPGIAKKIQSIWLLTALILFVRKVTVYQSFVTYLKAGSSPVEDISRLETFGNVIRQNHIKRVLGLYTNCLTASPLLVGFRHPAVILTKETLSDADFYYIILHELTHYKRRDLFYKWLVQITVCLHWFNPFVYLMAYEVSRMCELSCDEAVTKHLDAKGKRAYGDTLLRALGAGGFYNHATASVTFNGGKQLLKERLGAIMNMKKRSKLTTAAAFAAAVLLAGSAVAAGAYVQPSAKKVQTTAAQEEYPAIGITKKNGAYYYKGRRIRIFMDQRKDYSFVTFKYDKNGKIDIRLQRAEDLSVETVSILTKAEAAEILEDMDLDTDPGTVWEDPASIMIDTTQTDSEPAKNVNQGIYVSRLTKTELPAQVKEAVDQCKNGTWYLIKDKSRTYIYYPDLANDYAFEPSLSDQKAKIKISDMRGRKGYVLLAVSGNIPVTVTYQGRKVTCRKIPL